MLVQSTPPKKTMMLSPQINPVPRPHHAQLQQDNDASERPKGSITSISGLQDLLTSYLTLVSFFIARSVTY